MEGLLRLVVVVWLLEEVEVYGVERSVVRQEGEGMYDGGQGLDRGRALGGGGSLHHQGLPGQHQLPQGVQVVQQGEQHRGELCRGGDGGGDCSTRAGDGLLVLSVVTSRGKVELYQGAQHWQSQMISGCWTGPLADVVTGHFYCQLAGVKIFSNI